MPKAPPSHQQLESAIPIIYHEMGQMFAYYFWWHAREILSRETGFREDGMPHGTLQNSAIVASLLAVRKLNEFFKTRPPNNNERDDDLRGYDFPGYTATGSVIPADD